MYPTLSYTVMTNFLPLSKLMGAYSPLLHVLLPTLFLPATPSCTRISFLPRFAHTSFPSAPCSLTTQCISVFPFPTAPVHAFDGKGRVELKQGDYVTIQASQFPFPTVLSRQTEWFDSIARTLRWNSRGAQQKAWYRSFSGDGALGEDIELKSREPEWDIDTDGSVYSDNLESTSPFKRAMVLGV